MRGEIYVTYLVVHSPLALGIANERRDAASVHEHILDELRDPQRLKQAGPKFEIIAEAIETALSKRSPLRPFVEADWDRLKIEKVRRELAAVLRDEHGPFKALLDPVRIANEIEAAVGPGDVPANDRMDAEQLFYRLVREDGYRIREIRNCYGFSENAWGSHMEANHWILPGADESLRCAAAWRGWVRGQGLVPPTMVIAAIIDRARKPSGLQVSGLEKQLRPLAIVAVRRRVTHLAAELRREALEYAQAASAIRGLKPVPGLDLLPGWIELYERQAVVQGLLRLLGGKTMISALLDQAKKVQPASGGEPDLDARLVVNSNIYEQGLMRKRSYVRFEVVAICRTKDAIQPQVILTVSGLPVEAYEPVKLGIEQLRGSDLAPPGTHETLGDRLLATPVTVPIGLTGFLRGAVERHPVQIAETMVLCSITDPVRAVVPWRKELRTELPSHLADTKRDLSFPHDIDDIVERLRARCHAEDKQPIMVGEELARDE